MKSISLRIATASALALAASAAQAKDAAPELVKCDQSLGTIALVDGDQAGWTEWGLGSPRDLINALAVESGCFAPYSAAGGQPARFLVTAIAGSAEEVDKSVEMAKATDAALVDYLGLGPVFGTATKADHAQPVGFDGLARMVAASSLPTVAIGGLKSDHIDSVRATNADGMAVVSAICGQSDPCAAARAFARAPSEYVR